MSTKRLLELAGIKNPKKGKGINLEMDTESNTKYRKVIHTDANMQLVLMHIKPKQDIGLETHVGSQFIRIVKGTAESNLDGVKSELSDGDAIVIPPGIKHNITNTSDSNNLHLYAIYSPPEHPADTINIEKP